MTTRLMIMLGLALSFPAILRAQGVDNYLNQLKWSLDHYRFYTNGQGNPAVPADLQPVELTGQFDTKAVSRKVQQFQFLGVPSTKNTEPILNRHAHLGWYSLDTKDQQQPPRSVTATNQWGQHKFITGDLVGLLVPTEKIETGSEFPKRLDHYAVYQVHTVKYPKAIPGYIDTVDQFGNHEDCDIRIASHFAVPVVKKHGTKTTEIVNAKDHFLIYLASGKTRLTLERTIQNQFHLEPPSIHPRLLYYFAVPASKDAWEPIDKK